MAKKKRIQRSREDLKAELSDQLLLLQMACERFDSGVEAIAKHIALSLRVLLHHHGQSQSLLEQLGIRDIRFVDTAGAPLNPKNLLTECNLVAMEMSNSGATYKPLCSVGGSPISSRYVSLHSWWNEPVVKDNQGRTFNRREIILHVADTDGGAHVDSELDEAYMDLSRRNSLGWIFYDGNTSKSFENKVELVCVRQIAYEFMVSLKDSYPTLTNSTETE